jgi:hypothetical protein
MKHLRCPCLVFLLTMQLQIFAEPAFHEIEPNNSPSDFHRVSAEVTLYGTMMRASKWLCVDGQ